MVHQIAKAPPAPPPPHPRRSAPHRQEAGAPAPPTAHCRLPPAARPPPALSQDPSPSLPPPSRTPSLDPLLQLNLSRSGAATVAVPVSDTGIAFASDIKYRFANYTPQYFNPVIGPERGGFNLTAESGGATPKENQRFMVWMRLSALPHFRKLWGIISTDLKQGDVVTVRVYNRYNTYSFNGHKSIVLGTTTWLGGNNMFLGVAFLVTGGLAWLLAVVYLIARLSKPRKFADVSLLSFNKPVAGGS